MILLARSVVEGEEKDLGNWVMGRGAETPPEENQETGEGLEIHNTVKKNRCLGSGGGGGGR